MPTYYAWSEFPIERNDFGQDTKVIHVGEKVTAAKLNLSEDEFKELIAVGAVRAEEYPDTPPTLSPAEFKLAQIKQEAAQQEVTLAVEEAAPSSSTTEDKGK